MISLSMSETGSMALKAARGAGYRWGLAEEAAGAVVWLERLGLSGMAGLADLCECRDSAAMTLGRLRTTQANWQAEEGDLCPLSTGAYMSDLGAGLSIKDGELRAGPLHTPLLFVAFAALAAEALGRPLQVSWPGAELVVSGERIAVVEDSGIDAMSAEAVEIIFGEFVGVDDGSRNQRCLLTEATARRIGEFVSRTYVPESETSRKRGAGAGLIDGD